MLLSKVLNSLIFEYEDDPLSLPFIQNFNTDAIPWRFAHPMSLFDKEVIKIDGVVFLNNW